MAIDLRLDELRYPLRPVWIFAFRQPRVPQPEGALLLDVRDDQFRVRFRRDGREEWLGHEQVLLRPSERAEIEELKVRPPEDGTGSPLLKDSLVSEGDALLCFRGNMWHPVTAVDVSPFGVVIHWDGLGADQDRIEPRTQLRRGAQ